MPLGILIASLLYTYCNIYLYMHLLCNYLSIHRRDTTATEANDSHRLKLRPESVRARHKPPPMFASRIPARFQSAKRGSIAARCADAPLCNLSRAPFYRLYRINLSQYPYVNNQVFSLLNGKTTCHCTRPIRRSKISRHSLARPRVNLSRYLITIAKKDSLKGQRSELVVRPTFPAPK